MADGRFVSWDRWDAEHRALIERVNLLAREIDEWKEKAIENQAERHNKVWQGVLLILGGLVLPLTVVGILALLNLGGN
jgi:CHASE3 domain sensor protein